VAQSPRIKTIGLIVIAVLAAALCVAAAHVFNFGDHLKGLLEKIDRLGAWSPVLFVGMYVIAALLFLPGSILTMGAGVLFGVIKGSILVEIAATLGAAAAFLVGRYAARDPVSRWLKRNRKFERLDEAVEKSGWKIVALSRLSPVFPYNVLNYAYGITRISFWRYAFSSCLGMIPGTVMYVYLGSLAGTVAHVGSRQSNRPPIVWAFYGIGFLAALAVTIYVTRLAKKAMKSIQTGG
jgi:uncharacterized membrane protein YdjX (TVP38/TMEM64 family)